MSWFCAKYFSKVMTSLSSYKEDEIELALNETFLILDEILKMKNVNEYLTYNSKLLQRKKIPKDSFEFLDLRQINSAQNKHFSFINNFYKSTNIVKLDNEKYTPKFIKNQPFSIPNKSLGKKYSILVKEPYDSHMSLEFDPGNEKFILNHQASKLGVRYFQVLDRNLYDNIYNFAGLIVEKSNQVDIRQSYAYNIGSTANIAIIKNGYLYIANAGDSLAISYKNGKAEKLNSEHNLDIPEERVRILKSGTAILHNRIEGRLNLTRALGDFYFKSKKGLYLHQQPVVVLPEINKYKISEEIEFIVIGTDGLWDCVDIQKLCDSISWKLKKGYTKKIILNEIFDNIISKDDNGK